MRDELFYSSLVYVLYILSLDIALMRQPQEELLTLFWTYIMTLRTQFPQHIVK
jgi:hypothetical protein